MTDTDDQNLEQLVRDAGPRRPMPEDMRHRLETSFRGELDIIHRRKTGRTAQFAAGIAACLVVTLFFTLRDSAIEQIDIASISQVRGEVLLQRGDYNGPLVEGGHIRTADRIRTGVGSLAVKSLNGGLDIRLDQHTELLALPNDTIRLVTGSVYVDAGPDSKPMTILVNDYQVSHIGTQYLVSTRDHAVSIAVREGSVQINSKNQIVSDLEHGTVITLAADATYEVVSITPFDNRWQWTHQLAPNIETDGMPLVDFLAWYERQSGNVVVYESSELAQTISDPKDPVKIVGSFDSTDVESVITIAMAINDFSHSTSDGVTTVMTGDQAD